MQFKNLLSSLEGLMDHNFNNDTKTDTTNNDVKRVDDMSLGDALTAVVKKYNSASVLEKTMVARNLYNYRITMSDETTENVKPSGPAARSFFSKHRLSLFIGVLVLVLVCVLLYFYGGSVHYLLTWPYHLLCKLVGDSTVSTSMTTAVPHWLFPFIETTVPIETVIKTGPGEFAKVVGCLLSVTWTACLGATAWYFRPKRT
jgi:hypothetical protein